MAIRERWHRVFSRRDRDSSNPSSNPSSSSSSSSPSPPLTTQRTSTSGSNSNRNSSPGFPVNAVRSAPAVSSGTTINPPKRANFITRTFTWRPTNPSKTNNNTSNKSKSKDKRKIGTLSAKAKGKNPEHMHDPIQMQVGIPTEEEDLERDENGAEEEGGYIQPIHPSQRPLTERNLRYQERLRQWAWGRDRRPRTADGDGNGDGDGDGDVSPGTVNPGGLVGTGRDIDIGTGTDRAERWMV